MCSADQSCLTLCDPTDWGPPGSSVHGILHARILEWVALSPPGALPDPGIKPKTQVSCISRWILYHCTTSTNVWPLFLKKSLFYLISIQTYKIGTYFKKKTDLKEKFKTCQTLQSQQGEELALTQSLWTLNSALFPPISLLMHQPQTVFSRWTTSDSLGLTLQEGTENK